MKPDIYQSVTDRIIAALQAGTAPWVRPWTNGQSAALNQPHNAFSGRGYNGVNWLLLGCADYESQGWLTYKQAADLGGHVRKGEHGIGIVFWQFNRVKDTDTGKERVIPFARGYTVFNVEQCEGLDASRLVTPPAPIAAEGSIMALAQSRGAVVRHGGDKAFFRLATDHVQMPSVTAFRSQHHYDSTLAHELTHWTGSPSRLNREFGKRFGSEAYAFEELVAEIGSAFVCAAHGVPLEQLQHADYVAAWLRILGNDNRAIFTASSKAKAAAEFLMGKAEAETDTREAA